MVAQTDHYVVVDKPALYDSQNSKEGRPSVVDWLRKEFQFAGLVHRLDFGTSGLMVCAKNAEAAAHLTEALQKGRIDRIYIALVFGKILPNSELAKKGFIESPLDEQAAVTHFKILDEFSNATLVEVNLETGRKHQIRRHFASVGHPLLGDHLYRAKGSDRLFHRPALHATKLIVEGKTYTSRLPDDFQELISRLKKPRAL